MAMWRSLNDAWKVNIDAGVQREVDLAYPPFREGDAADFGSCSALVAPTVTFLNRQTTVDPNAITPQPGWVYPINGQVPQGRIYVMPSSTTATGTAGGITPAPVTTSAEVHAVVGDDGAAYYYPTCVRR